VQPANWVCPVDKTIFSIGHSTRKISEFVSILKKFGIETVVDVRRFPTSAKCPWYKRERLEKSLKRVRIKYEWFGDELGGFRPGGYKKYMRTGEFRDAIKKLLNLETDSIAIMCAEKFYWKCHRRFICDYLKAKGVKVVHIIDANHYI
jgi:uncharacterized protein (DUF488 family)